MNSTVTEKKNAKQLWPYVKWSERDGWVVDARTKEGGHRKYFTRKAHAETYAQSCRVRREGQGSSAFGNAELASFGKTVQDAIAFYLVHLRRQQTSVLVSKAITEFTAHKKAEGISERYAGDLKIRLANFQAAFGEQEIAAVTSEQISAWLDGLPVSAVTRNTFRRRLGVLFAYTKHRKWRPENPFAGGKKAEVATAKEKRKKVRILSAGESAHLLDAASEETRAFWAIALFAGLRPESEIGRLRWEQIDFKQRVITVDGHESDTEETKTGRRVVKMSGNLLAWLRPLAQKSGLLVQSIPWKQLRADKRKIGFGTPGTETPEETKNGVALRSWPEDITRHTFGSNLLAQCGDIGIVSTQMGNSPNMVRKHYLSLIKPKESSAFWKIKPGRVATGKIIKMAPASPTAAGDEMGEGEAPLWEPPAKSALAQG